MGDKSVSAGVLLYRFVDGELEVFLGHPGGPYFINKDNSVWGIVKGGVNSGEDIEVAARREFFEETGKSLDKISLVYLGLFVQSKYKHIHIYAAEMDVDIDIVSNVFHIEYPKGSGEIMAVPELDKVDWFDVNDARVKILSGQVQVIDKLIEVVSFL